MLRGDACAGQKSAPGSPPPPPPTRAQCVWEPSSGSSCHVTSSWGGSAPPAPPFLLSLLMSCSRMPFCTTGEGGRGHGSLREPPHSGPFSVTKRHSLEFTGILFIGYNVPNNGLPYRDSSRGPGGPARGNVGKRNGREHPQAERADEQTEPRGGRAESRGRSGALAAPCASPHSTTRAPRSLPGPALPLPVLRGRRGARVS